MQHSLTLYEAQSLAQQVLFLKINNQCHCQKTSGNYIDKQRNSWSCHANECGIPIACWLINHILIMKTIYCDE